MLFKSALITAASGKINGMVASRGRSGQYLRELAIPVNPNTDRQNVQRSIFANLANLWQDLTPEQRSEWGLFADGTPSTNRLGQELILTGQNAYIKANSLLELIGEPLVSDPPAEFNNGQAVTADPDTWELDIDTDTWVLEANRAAGESVDGWVCTFRGKAQNPSRGFYGGPYQLADVEPILTAAEQAVLTAQIGVDDLSDYVIPETDALIPMRLVVQYADGRHSHSEHTLIAPTLTTTGV